MEAAPGQRYAFELGMNAHGDALTHASFPLYGDEVYVRITVVDDKGRCADTNAYFMDEIFG